jgi:hypothetical protein
MALVNEQILELLKDDREYYGGVGKNYLSNSDIGTLLENPKEYGKPREDNKAFAEGRYFHQSGHFASFFPPEPTGRPTILIMLVEESSKL